MGDNGSSGAGLGAKLFVGFLIVATALLSVLVLKLSKQNETLRATVEKLEAAAKSGGLIPGDMVETIQLQGPGADPYLLDFGEGKPFTLFLLTSAGCGACDETIPVWESALTEAHPTGLRVVNVCAGVADPAEAEGETSSMWTTYAAPQGREGWIRRIPLAPSALLIGGDGSVIQRWYGSMSEAQAAQMRMALMDVGGG